MASVLNTSRVPISLVPERLVADAAHEQGVSPADLRPYRKGDDVVLSETLVARGVWESAIRRWWKLVPLWVRLEFTMQFQQQTQWCWAALSVSVSRYYTPWSGWTQCEMVNQEKGQSTCCQDGSASECNQPHVLDAPLDRAGVLNVMHLGTVAYDAIRDEIDAGRPVAWRIGWSGGGGHFAVIEGYQRFGAQWVAVDDPWYGSSDAALFTLTSGGYQGSGTWTHTYFTRRPPLIFVPPLEEIRLPWEIWERMPFRHHAAVGGADGP